MNLHEIIAAKLKEQKIGYHNIEDKEKRSGKKPYVLYKDSGHDVDAWQPELMNSQEVWLYMALQSEDPAALDLFIQTVRDIQAGKFHLELFSIYPYPDETGLIQHKYKISLGGE